MSQSLARWQQVVLGLVVLAAVGLGGVGVARIAAKQGLWADTVDLAVGFPEVHDVSPGAPVRIRGVDAGQVVAIDYPDADTPGAAVTLKLRLDAKFADRLYADATVRIHSTGLLGAKVIAISPGTPAAGKLASNHLTGTVPPDLADAAAKLRDTATEAELLLKEIRASNGTVSKLLKDDDLYRDLKGVTADAAGFLKRADQAVAAVEAEIPGVRAFVRDGQATLGSIKAGTDAFQRMPLIRGYVENAVPILVRPAQKRERMVYAAADLFEANTAVLTDGGRTHLQAVAGWLKGVKNDKAEVVAAALCDPAARDQTTDGAAELTRKQAEAVVEFLKSQGVHKLGWWTRRTMTPLGLGMGPSPVVEAGPLPASRVEVILYSPQ